MNSTHNAKTKRLIAAVAVAAATTVTPFLLFVASSWSAAPAFATCNEGTPNCVGVDAGHKKVQDQLNDAGTSGQCAGPDGFCDDDIPGSDVEPSEGAVKPTTKPVTIHAPVTTYTR
jgi:hypothetical protein